MHGNWGLIGNLPPVVGGYDYLMHRWIVDYRPIGADTPLWRISRTNPNPSLKCYFFPLLHRHLPLLSSTSGY